MILCAGLISGTSMDGVEAVLLEISAGAFAVRRALHLAHMSGHLHAPHNCAGEQSLSNRARTAMPALGTMSHITPAKAVTFHDAFKSTTLGDANRIHIIADREDIGPHNVAHF